MTVTRRQQIQNKNNTNRMKAAGNTTPKVLTPKVTRRSTIGVFRDYGMGLGMMLLPSGTGASATRLSAIGPWRRTAAGDAG